MFADFDWRGAEMALQRAISLNSSYATAHQRYADYLAIVGRLDEAIVESKRARNLDPLSRVLSNEPAVVYLIARRYDDAIREARSTLELDSEFWATHLILCGAYLRRGHPARRSPSVSERWR